MNIYWLVHNLTKIFKIPSNKVYQMTSIQAMKSLLTGISVLSSSKGWDYDSVDCTR